jgi:hypothetical protein
MKVEQILMGEYGLIKTKTLIIRISAINYIWFDKKKRLIIWETLI